jgi:hypothetical protein
MRRPHILFLLLLFLALAGCKREEPFREIRESIPNELRPFLVDIDTLGARVYIDELTGQSDTMYVTYNNSFWRNEYHSESENKAYFSEQVTQNIRRNKYGTNEGKLGTLVVSAGTFCRPLFKPDYLDAGSSLGFGRRAIGEDFKARYVSEQTKEKMMCDDTQNSACYLTQLGSQRLNGQDYQSLTLTKLSYKIDSASGKSEQYVSSNTVYLNKIGLSYLEIYRNDTIALKIRLVNFIPKS